MPRFDLRPDPSSPVPLYHQIAEALRYRIATGAIRIGTVLPPLREAARLWSVNLHTVRRAYAQLAGAGIVETRAPLGTQVLPATGGPALPRAGAAGRAAVRAREAFLARVVGEARKRHGLSLDRLLALLGDRRVPSGATSGATVYVAECSASQAADLARQLEERWRVHAVPWPIDRPPPPGPHAVVATYFHYNDLRSHWPDRFADVRFVAISPDQALPARLLAGQAEGGAPGSSRADRALRGRGAARAGARNARRVPVLLCERDDSMLRNIAADVSRLLPAERFHVTTRLLRRPGALLSGVHRHDRVLVAPRIWGSLPDAMRADPRVHELRYVFDPEGLDAVGRDLAWAPRQEV
jgi:DNA-binding transcriptional regulator YhcF (GntR family)